jgi:hypothetical protein
MRENRNIEAMKDANDTNDRNDMEDRNHEDRRSKIDTSVKRLFEFQPRVKMRLSEIERLIKKHRIIVPPPSRQTLIKLCEEGTLETAGDRPTLMGWLVFEDSFLAWLKKMDCVDDHR